MSSLEIGLNFIIGHTVFLSGFLYVALLLHLEVASYAYIGHAVWTLCHLCYSIYLEYNYKPCTGIIRASNLRKNKIYLSRIDDLFKINFP